jgi:hypothetical protein
VIVLWQVWRGWRTGLFRQLMVVAGLLAGWVIGLTQGPAFFAHFWSRPELPSFILVPLASMTLGLAVYALALLAGRLLFKRACDHPIGPTRLFLGAGGALVGLFSGLFGVWMVVAVVRLAGSLAQADRSGGSTAPAVVRVERSVESGLVGDFVRFTDPFPKETYTDLRKVGLIAADPALQERLWQAPGLREIATDPKVTAMREDPAVADALQRGDYLSLLDNPNFRAAIQDPRLSRRLQRVNITRVLNETVP